MLFFYKRNALKSKSIPLKSNFKAPNAKVNIMFTLFLVVAKVNLRASPSRGAEYDLEKGSLTISPCHYFLDKIPTLIRDAIRSLSILLT
jgi:hypothetical protein